MQYFIDNREPLEQSFQIQRNSNSGNYAQTEAPMMTTPFIF